MYLLKKICIYMDIYGCIRFGARFSSLCVFQGKTMAVNEISLHRSLFPEDLNTTIF